MGEEHLLERWQQQEHPNQSCDISWRAKGVTLSGPGLGSWSFPQVPAGAGMCWSVLVQPQVTAGLGEVALALFSDPL